MQVYQLLAPEAPIQTIAVTPVEIEDALLKLQQNPDSLAALAANMGIKYLGYERIFVRPFTQHNELAITPFAQALQAEITGRVDAISDKNYAFYELVGHYQHTETGIQISAQLINVTREGLSEIAAASSHHIQTQFVSQFQSAPVQPSFDRVLTRDTLTSAELEVKLRTNKGNRDLLFNQGETVVLQIKANRPVFYHLVGHSSNQEQQISYLLDLSNAKGLDKFVQNIDQPQVNRWQTIGEFVVHPPFGIESLQLIAYEDKTRLSLPQINFSGDYYQIEGSSQSVVQKTRGLVRKSRANTAQQTPKADISEVVNSKATITMPEVSESVIQFTTRSLD